MTIRKTGAATGKITGLEGRTPARPEDRLQATARRTAWDAGDDDALDEENRQADRDRD